MKAVNAARGAVPNRGVPGGVLLGLLLLAAVPSVDGSVREVALDDNYQWGHLTWKAGNPVGGLAWEPGAASDDPGGPAQSTDSVERNKQLLYGSLIRNVAESNPFLPPPVEFLSDPLPRTTFVNASRLVRLDLFLTGCSGASNPNADPQFSVELWAGEQFFTGAQYASDVSYIVSFGDATPPKVPSGYCMRVFRMQAELDLLPAGTVLKLRILAESQSAWHQFGTGKDHRSVLQIPFFPPDEAIFRYPELAPGTPIQVGTPSEETFPIDLGRPTWTALLGLLAGPLALRRRKAAVLAGLLLFSTILGGCLGEAVDPSKTDEDAARRGGSAKESILEDDANSTGLTNQSLGALAGFVHDDQGQPIPDAHVTLYGMDTFTKTNRAGQFTLSKIPPGAYTLRADHASYVSFEGAVTIRAGSITRLDVTLDARVQTVDDFKPHRHDRWGAEDRITIFEDTLPVVLPVAETFVLGTFGHDQTFRLPMGSVILPGTRVVEVEVTWRMSWLQRVTLSFRSNVEEKEGNVTWMYPREQGEAFGIRAIKEMADLGHHEVSTWGTFRISPARFDANTANVAQRTVEPTEYTVKVTIVKGLVPYEPAHTDLWQGKTALVLLDGAAPQCCSDGRYAGYTGWRPAPLVPPGTASLDIRLNLSKPSVRNIHVAARYANMPANTADTDYRVLTPKESGTLYKSYHLDLKPEEADPFYAKVSNWFFIANYPTDQGERVMKLVDDGIGIATGPILLTLTVIAHREAQPPA